MDSLKPSPTSSSLSSREIALYYANQIGYVRALLAVGGVLVAKKDILDGHVARAYQQCSLFGQILDMIVDRMSNVLSISEWHGIVTSLLSFALVFDIAGHWINTLTTAMIEPNATHKVVDEDLGGIPFLGLYYRSKPVMFICHASYEAYIMTLFTEIQLPELGETLRLLRYILTIPAMLKIYTNFIQIFYGLRKLGRAEAGQRIISTQ